MPIHIETVGLISTTMRLDGWDRLTTVLRVSPELGLQALGRSLYATANKIFNESQMQVPVRRGILRSTGFVSPPAFQGNGQLAVRISYGGASAPYAYDQHYNLAYRHAPGRKALYLSDPVYAATPNLERWIQADVGRTLSGLGL